MAVIKTPYAVHPAFNDIEVVDDENTSLAIQAVEPDASRSVTLYHVRRNGEAKFNIRNFVSKLFIDRTAVIETATKSGWALKDYNLYCRYTIADAGEFVALNAVQRKGETLDLVAYSEHPALTARVPDGDGVISIPKYDGYPVGVTLLYRGIYSGTPGTISYEWIMTRYARWVGVSNDRVQFDPATAPAVVPAVTDGDRLTSAENMFLGCADITQIEYFDASNIVSAFQMCLGCTGLTSFLALNTEWANDFRYAFAGCGFSTGPNVDMRNTFNASSMLRGCPNLESIPAYQTLCLEDMSYMLADCPKFTTMPVIWTDDVYNAAGTWMNCVSLKELPPLRFENVTDATDMLKGCTAVTTLGGFGGIKVSFDVSDCPLTKDSLQNLANGMATVTNSPTITLGAVNRTTAGDTIMAQMAAKGWNVAGYDAPAIIDMACSTVGTVGRGTIYVLIGSGGRIYTGTDLTNMSIQYVDFELNRVRCDIIMGSGTFAIAADGHIGTSSDGITWEWVAIKGNWLDVATAGATYSFGISSNAICLHAGGVAAELDPDMEGLAEIRSLGGLRSIHLAYADTEPFTLHFAVAGENIAGLLSVNFEAASAEEIFKFTANVYEGYNFSEMCKSYTKDNYFAVGRNSAGQAVVLDGAKPWNVIPEISPSTDWTLASATGWTKAGGPAFGDYNGYACMRATSTTAAYTGVYGLYSALPVLTANVTVFVAVDVYAESGGIVSLCGGTVNITEVGRWHTVTVQRRPSANSSVTVYNSSPTTSVMYFKNLRVSYARITIVDESDSDIVGLVPSIYANVDTWSGAGWTTYTGALQGARYYDWSFYNMPTKFVAIAAAPSFSGSGDGNPIDPQPLFFVGENGDIYTTDDTAEDGSDEPARTVFVTNILTQ